MRVLAVDDEAPALDDLVYLLRSDPRISEVSGVRDGAAALRALDRALAADRPFAAVFLDVRMPGLDGIVLGRLLAQFAAPPRLVYVTAHEEHAVHAFEVQAADYLLKPVRPERLAETVRRITDDTAPPPDPEPLAVELSGVTRFVQPGEVHYIEAQGDYARLHTASGSHLVRIPLAALEDRWRQAGLVRIHRSHLVAVRHITELRLDSGRCTVVVAGAELPVSRRHTRELRDLLLRRDRP
ncbi:LytR/AlgR family response regulator transcription factor [Actinocorallia populi]|uniref:LytR/AlgR family response regulator transcription factor n=1 Tax=Actinocorallia populi TaxID=2079200 RepID=UPI000D08C306|nr:LytTR family DNA-binding domain-containing protein [Actinocorallia populi]